MRWLALCQTWFPLPPKNKVKQKVWKWVWETIPAWSGRALALPSLWGSVITSGSWKICCQQFSSSEQAFCHGLFSALSQLVDLGDSHWCFSCACCLLALMLVSWCDVRLTRRAKAWRWLSCQGNRSFKWCGWTLLSYELPTASKGLNLKGAVMQELISLGHGGRQGMEQPGKCSKVLLELPVFAGLRKRIKRKELGLMLLANTSLLLWRNA